MKKKHIVTSGQFEQVVLYKEFLILSAMKLEQACKFRRNMKSL